MLWFRVRENLGSSILGIHNLSCWQDGLFVFLIFIFEKERDRDRKTERERERERERAKAGERQRERETESETGSRLWAISTEPDVGLKPVNCEIMTWDEVGYLTNWATQVPHKMEYLKVRPTLRYYKCQKLNQLLWLGLKTNNIFVFTLV